MVSKIPFFIPKLCFEYYTMSSWSNLPPSLIGKYWTNPTMSTPVLRIGVATAGSILLLVSNHEPILILLGFKLNMRGWQQVSKTQKLGLPQDLGTLPKTSRARDCPRTLRSLRIEKWYVTHVGTLGFWDCPEEEASKKNCPNFGTLN